jgi:hypothetical protein
VLGSGCFERDGVAECLELSDEVSGLAGGVEPVGAVVRSEVDVAGVGVVQAVPDDHENGSGDSDELASKVLTGSGINVCQT